MLSTSRPAPPLASAATRMTLSASSATRARHRRRPARSLRTPQAKRAEPASEARGERRGLGAGPHAACYPAPPMHEGRRRSELGRRPLAARGLGVLALASCLALTGCLELIRSSRVSRVCTPEAARKAGDGDARAAAPPRESYARICGVAEPSLNGIYTE